MYLGLAVAANTSNVLHLNLGLMADWGLVHGPGWYLSSGYGYRSDTARDGHGPSTCLEIAVGAEAEMRVSRR